MPQTPPFTLTTDGATLRMRPLTPADRQAVIDHFLSLSPEDYYLRFGTSKDHDFERLPLVVHNLFRAVVLRKHQLYGGWDARGETLLVCLGLCVHDPARPTSLEMHMSAVPHVRGGLVQSLSGWLIGELMRQKATEVVVTYQQGNGPVQRLVRQMGMSPVEFDGVPFFRLRIDAHARLVETWLEKTDALMAAAREEMAEPQARL